MWWWQLKNPSSRERRRRGHQYPPSPTTPVALRYFLLNTKWLVEILDVGKRVVAVDGCYLDCSTHMHLSLHQAPAQLDSEVPLLVVSPVPISDSLASVAGVQFQFAPKAW